MEQARSTLASALEKLNAYMESEVAGLRSAVGEAGLGLLGSAPPVTMPE